MNVNLRADRAGSNRGSLVMLFLILLGIYTCPAALAAVGSWTTLASAPPNNVGVELMLLLSDGTVMAQQVNASSNWFRLTPDIHGSYINGTWSVMAPMNYTRQFYASAVLQDGRVFVAGGEYGTGGSTAEVYDPRNNSWTIIPIPPGLICTTCTSPGFSDAGCVVLPNGNVLIAPVTPTTSFTTVIFNPNSNSFSLGPSYLGSQNEASWVKLPDDSILTIDATSNPNLLNSSERFIPSLNNGQGGWIPDRQLTVPMYNSATETGAGVLLPDGRAFFIGGNGQTAYYTPSGNTNQGTWATGPLLVSPGQGWDEPAAVMINGKVLYQTVLGPKATPQPRAFYEMDPTVNYPIGTITNAPDWGDTSGVSHIMLNLPDGNVLVSYGDSTVRVYLPNPNLPIASAKPSINSIAPVSNGSFHLTGTQLNGISQGSSFGDDAQMDSNYPLVRLADSAGNFYYGRTFNWSSTSVATGNKIVTTEFTLPGQLAPATYSLVAVANGIASDPVSFAAPAWVDFNNLGSPQTGSFLNPFNTLALGVANVPSGGTIFIKAPGSSPETMTISKPMTLMAVGGAVSIGH